MPVEAGAGDWRDWIVGIATALGLGGVAGMLRSWAKQGRLDDRVDRLERDREENARMDRETRETVIALRERFADLEGRLDRGFARTDARLDAIHTAIKRQSR